MRQLVLIISLSVLLAGCSDHDPTKRAVAGGVLGAGGGALAGALAGGGKGALIGGGIGAVGGAAIGALTASHETQRTYSSGGGTSWASPRPVP